MRRLGLLLLLLCAATTSTCAADPPAQKFVVFFQDWSAALDSNAQAVIGNAASWVKTHPGNVAHVNGFADPTGSKVANALLSELRAQVVVDQLQADGVGPSQIEQKGHGSVQYALTGQESRRVEISISRP
ncbi:MAG TPA: OmpA family protein [Acetobacteraceae bacterium]|jgi:outer membrane protein OmpA-like peptidoglycan-associated protein|nr:OmpA family protein [Acetobacteraceae bacterium]